MIETSLRKDVWRSNVNSYLGIAFISVCALWAFIVIWEAGFGTNPVVEAFAKTVYRETTYTPYLP